MAKDTPKDYDRWTGKVGMKDVKLPKEKKSKTVKKGNKTK